MTLEQTQLNIDKEMMKRVMPGTYPAPNVNTDFSVTLQTTYDLKETFLQHHQSRYQCTTN